MYVISNRDRYITGKGIAGARIEVTLPNGTVYNTTVSNNGDWNVVTNYLAVGSTVKAIQKENGKNNSEVTIQTVVQAQDLVIGNNKLEFNVKTTVPVRVFIIFKGSSLGASMDMMGGNINVAGGTRSIFRTENITFQDFGNGSDTNVGVSGGLYRITMVPINPSDQITPETSQFIIKKFGDIQGNLELENVTEIQDTPSSSTNTGRVTIKYLNRTC